ncbi:MAG TPA: MBL fold metallo-hydrolase [Beijerinckiaceae bacterium]|nr:MBL fold metallo-hydrolase [Beijerinckiaceae bacterium]
MTDTPPPLQIGIIPVTPFQQNCAILRCTATNKAAIVDPGGDADHIVAAVKKMGVTVEKILLTHGHLDHAGGVAGVVAELKVPVEGPHVGDKPLLEGIARQGRMYGVEGLQDAWSDRYLVEGDTVSVGNLIFDVLFVPGHSPGSVVFVSRQAPIAFVGDTIFQGSIGRTDLPGCDHDLLISGIKSKLYALPDETICLSGHGPATTIGDEKRSNPFVRG